MDKLLHGFLAYFQWGFLNLMFIKEKSEFLYIECIVNYGICGQPTFQFDVIPIILYSFLPIHYLKIVLNRFRGLYVYK